MATLSLVLKGFTAPSRTFLDAAVATGTDTITIPDHNLQNGDVVRFTNSGGALPTGLTSSHPYYVISRAADTFKVSATSGGSAVDISAAAGTGTHTVTLQESRFTELFSQAAGAPNAAMIAFSNYFQSLASGFENASVDMHHSATDPVAASGTVTCATVAADDTVTIAGVTLTAKASPTGEAQFSQAGTNTQDGDSLAAIINAHSILGKFYTATNLSGVVTVTAKVKGQWGNLPTITSSDGATLAVVTFAGGTGGPMNTCTTYNRL
jgi:hypothetical protein